MPELQRIVRTAASVDSSDNEKRIATWKASTELVDRYGDIVRLQAWDKASLRHFSKSGKILKHHAYWSDPVAKATKAWIDDNKKALMVTAQFPEAGVLADSDDAWAKMRAGLLDEVSVGFLPHEDAKRPTDEEREALGMGKWGVIFEAKGSLELLELSMVAVPANPEAMLDEKMLRSLRGSEAAELVEMLTILRACDTRMKESDNMNKRLVDLVSALEARMKLIGGSAGAAPVVSTERESSYSNEIGRSVESHKKRLAALNELAESIRKT